MRKINNIYETTDYDQFGFLLENRTIDKNHVQKLVKELKSKGQQMPAKVTDKFKILEGQHRFLGCKILNIPFKFFIEKQHYKRLDQLDNLISIQKGKDWTIKDHLSSQVKRQSPNYLEFNSLVEKYRQFSISSLLLVFKIDTSDFKNGKINVTYFDHGIKILESALLLKPFYEFYNRATFVIALSTVASRTNFDLDYFNKKCKSVSNMLTGCNGRDAYVDMIISVYNYKRKTGRI
tara:strand:+ start:3010 stop:3714 length:705 start_codon:yes stop_codon:yes gene_type:complete